MIAVHVCYGRQWPSHRTQGVGRTAVLWRGLVGIPGTPFSPGTQGMGRTVGILGTPCYPWDSRDVSCVWNAVMDKNSVAQSALLDPRSTSSILDHHSSILDHRSSILDHRSSILDHRSSVNFLDPRSSLLDILDLHSSILGNCYSILGQLPRSSIILPRSSILGNFARSPLILDLHSSTLTSTVHVGHV